jgi:hypothetical protein
MRPSKYFYDKPLPKYLDSKTVLIYRPHPVYEENFVSFFISVAYFMRSLCWVRGESKEEDKQSNDRRTGRQADAQTNRQTVCLTDTGTDRLAKVVCHARKCRIDH